MLQELTVKGFAEELASNSPAPGGGSAAALAASLGSALGAMVFNLTIGKKAYKEYAEDVKALVDDSFNKVNAEKDEFIQLMDKDASEFLELMAAFKLPKDTEEEKAVRTAKINEGYAKALEIPLLVAKKAFSIYSYIEVAANYGNKNAISDAGVAALMIQTAIEGAALNVKINLSSIENEAYKQEVSNICNKLIEDGIACKERIMKVVNSKL